jgi:hypothetical protein
MAKKTSKGIKMTYLTLITEFHPSIISLGSLKITNMKALMGIAKARKQADEANKMFTELRKKIAEQDCKKDEKGNPVIDNNNYTYASEKVKQEANKLINELHHQEVVLDIEPFDFELLDGVDGLTGNIIAGLGELIKE